MLKKLTLMAMSVAALLAFAAPASANGPLITTSTGAAATSITATSTNTKTTTPLGTLECRTVTLQGNISTNANTTAHGTNGTGTGVGTVPANTHTGHCGSGPGPVHILDVKIGTIHLTRHAGPSGAIETTGTANFDFTYRITTIFGTQHCHFRGTGVPIRKTGADSITVNGPVARVAALSPGALCPETGTIHGDFTVRAQNGLPAVIH